MAVGLQLVGLVLGVLSWCLQSSSTSSHTWKMKSHVEAVTTSQWQFEGLWMSCAATALGSVQCSKFKTVLGLSGERFLAPTLCSLRCSDLLHGTRKEVSTLRPPESADTARPREKFRQLLLLIHGETVKVAGSGHLTVLPDQGRPGPRFCSQTFDRLNG